MYPCAGAGQHHRHPAHRLWRRTVPSPVRPVEGARPGPAGPAGGPGVHGHVHDRCHRHSRRDGGGRNSYKSNAQFAGQQARENLINKLRQLDIKKAKDLLYGFVDSTGIKHDWIINNSNNSQTMETILNNATRSDIGTLIKNTLLERVQNRGQQQGM